MKTLAALLALATFSVAALADNAAPATPIGHPAMPGAPAAAPAGHPGMPAAGHGAAGPADMSKSDAPLTKKGKVLTVIDAKQFTYFEVQDGAKTLWVASPAIALKPGNMVKYAEAPIQAKYHSPSLNRDFNNIMFTVKAVVE